MVPGYELVYECSMTPEHKLRQRTSVFGSINLASATKQRAQVRKCFFPPHEIGVFSNMYRSLPITKAPIGLRKEDEIAPQCWDAFTRTTVTHVSQSNADSV